MDTTEWAAVICPECKGSGQMYYDVYEGYITCRTCEGKRVVRVYLPALPVLVGPEIPGVVGTVEKKGKDEKEVIQAYCPYCSKKHTFPLNDSKTRSAPFRAECVTSHETFVINIKN